MAFETVTITPAASPPGPPELLPGRPDAIVDLQTSEGVGLVGGQWRFADAHVQEIDFVAVGHPDDPLGPGTVPNRTHDVVPHAEASGYDDSSWRVLEPEETTARLASGRVCFNWYRLSLTLPHRVGEEVQACARHHLRAVQHAVVRGTGQPPGT